MTTAPSYLGTWPVLDPRFPYAELKAIYDASETAPSTRIAAAAFLEINAAFDTHSLRTMQLVLHLGSIEQLTVATAARCSRSSPWLAAQLCFLARMTSMILRQVDNAVLDGLEETMEALGYWTEVANRPTLFRFQSLPWRMWLRGSELSLCLLSYTLLRRQPTQPLTRNLLDPEQLSRQMYAGACGGDDLLAPFLGASYRRRHALATVDDPVALMAHVQGALGDIHTLAAALRVPSPRSSEPFEAVAALEDHVSVLVDGVSALPAAYRRPSRLFRWWPAYLAGGVAALLAFRAVVHNRAAISSVFTNGVDLVRAFWDKQVVGSVTSIYRTIRYDDSTLGVAGSGSLAADSASLARMVTDFAVSRGMDDPAQLGAVVSAAERGDITLIMLQYESDIQTPIRGALLGELIRALLIQVQKEKVDLERAKLALDQILKSNDLNFRFVAAIPALLVGGFILYEARALWRGDGQAVSTRQQHYAIQSTVRAIELLLFRCHPRTQLTENETGHLVLAAIRLRRLARGLAPHTLADRFRQDAAMLLAPDMHVSGLSAVIARIVREYHFLAPGEWRQ